jgi:DNA polymerase phi
MTTSTTAKTTLELFWLLAKSPKERVDASVKLIGALEAFQVQHQPRKGHEEESETSDNEDDDDDEEQEYGVDGAKEGRGDRLDARNAPDVAYSIRRLVRGLASPRENARLGYSVALTEVIYSLSCLSHVSSLPYLCALRNNMLSIMLKPLSHSLTVII